MTIDTISVNQLKFKKVLSQNQREIGTIEDIVINQETQQIAYVILKMRGLMGFGDKRIPVPLTILEFEEKSPHRIILNVERSKLKRAPMIEPEDLPTFDLMVFMKKINEYYQSYAGVNNTGFKLRNVFRKRSGFRNSPYMKVSKVLPSVQIKSA